MAISVLCGYEATIVLGFVAAKHKDVVDAQEVQVDKGIFCLHFRESAANHVRHGGNVVMLLNGSSHSHSAGTIALGYALIKPIGSALVHHLAAVSGDVDI